MKSAIELGAIAYDAFCRDITHGKELPDYYFECWDGWLDPDIKRAWIHAAVAVASAVKSETERGA